MGCHNTLSNDLRRDTAARVEPAWPLMKNMPNERRESTETQKTKQARTNTNKKENNMEMDMAKREEPHEDD